MGAETSHSPPTELFANYATGGFYDEMFVSPGVPRPHYAKLFRTLAAMAPEQFSERRKLADVSFLMQGITFTVYSDGAGTERLFPFDLIPRIVPHAEWERVERGLTQRVLALSLVLKHVNGPKRIVEDKRVPRELIYSCKHIQQEMHGLK